MLKGRKSRALLDADLSDGDNSADSAEHEKLEDVMHSRMQALRRRQRSSVGNLMRSVSSVDAAGKPKDQTRKASFVLPARMPSLRKLSCSASSKVAAAPATEQGGRFAVPKGRSSGERLRRALAMRRYTQPED